MQPTESKVLDLPGNAHADPSFYDELPTARRNGDADDGNLPTTDGGPKSKDPRPFEITGGR